MFKIAAGFAIATLIMLFAPASVERGMRDATESLMNWKYYEIRDMRQTVVLDPQKTITRGPDSLSVPLTGREHVSDLQTLAASLVNPIPMSEASIAAGDTVYKVTCTPCHGLELKGDGPITQFYIPPPDLQGAGTRDRSDGYIYSYIRNGGAVMPAYGFQVSAENAWHLVNFIRSRQQADPR